jgi:hypothetical protein
MSLHSIRPVVIAAFVAALGLVCLPACKKKSKSTEPDSPSSPNPGGPPSAPNGADTSGLSRPLFKTTDPRTATLRASSLNNAKMIMIAMHAFSDTNGALPGGIADKTGKPGLSWRVALLPYVEHDNLYKQFKLDEPWDSEHNKKLIPMMPKIYSPGTDTRGYTFYRGFTGPTTWLPPQQQSMRPGQIIPGARFGNFTDGLSNTIVVAEAYDPVIWTKPDEMPFAPNSVPKLGGVFANGAVVALGDGTTRFLRSTISPQQLANAIQINDGKIVNLDE